MTHGNCRDDSILYTEDALLVGLLLFPPRTCSACGMTLPRCRDYFAPDAQVPDGMRTTCRRCRRLSGAVNYRRRKAVAS